MRISFTGRPIFIQLPPGKGGENVERYGGGGGGLLIDGEGPEGAGCSDGEGYGAGHGYIGAGSCARTSSGGMSGVVIIDFKK